MTKQLNDEPEQGEKQNGELLLRRFRLMNDFVEDLRQQNIKAGIDQKVMKQFVPWYEFIMSKVPYEKWLEAVTNPNKPDMFWNIKDLKRTEKIPDDTESEYENNIYPYRRLDSLYKIKDKKGRLWLMRYETWLGCDIAGQERHISVNDLDYWVKPSVRYEYIPKDPENPNGPKIRVGNILDNRGLDPAGERVYLTPYSLEKVQEFLQYATPKSEFEELRPGVSSGTALILEKEGHHGTTVSYEEFISEDFDGIYKRAAQPAASFKIDKEFMNQLRGNNEDNTAKNSGTPYS